MYAIYLPADDQEGGAVGGGGAGSGSSGSPVTGRAPTAASWRSPAPGAQQQGAGAVGASGSSTGSTRVVEMKNEIRVATIDNFQVLYLYRGWRYW